MDAKSVSCGGYSVRQKCAKWIALVQTPLMIADKGVPGKPDSTSLPGTRLISVQLGQQSRKQTTNQEVAGSSPAGRTIKI